MHGKTTIKIISQLFNPSGSINGALVGSSEHSMVTYYLKEEAKNLST
jgi:hypothetical protein